MERETAERFPRSFGDPRLLVLAVAALFAGVMVYALGRNPGSVHFLPPALQFGLLPHSMRHLTGQLPTFAHVIAFSLVTAWALDCTRKQALAACAGWMLLEMAFEVGQLPTAGAWLASEVPHWFSRVWLLDGTAAFFLHGSFDPWDMVAAALGASVAFLVVLKIQPRR
ncbi:MAG: hypothetical protein ABSD44_10725 [Terracidiphilus sp.]